MTKQKNNQEILVKIFRDVVRNSSIDYFPKSLTSYVQENGLLTSFINEMSTSKEIEECISEVLSNPKTLLKAIIVPILRETKITPESILEELKVYTLRARKNRRYKMANKKEVNFDFTSYDPPTNEESPLNTIIAEEELVTIKNVIQEEKEKVVCVM